MVKLKFQNVYECKNLDFERTCESLCGILPSIDKTRKGVISFQITPKKIGVLIFPKGKVQVAWQDQKEKFLPSLESLLITDNGQKAELKPLSANVVNVPYPPPDSFSFAWCKEKFAFFQKIGFWGIVERRAERKEREREREAREHERELKELAMQIDIIRDEANTTKKEFNADYGRLKRKITKKWRKFYFGDDKP